MPSKGSSKEKRSSGGKATKAHAKLQPGSESPQVSPGGWQGPPTKDKE